MTDEPQTARGGLPYDAARDRELEFHDALAAPLVAAAMPPKMLDDVDRALVAQIGPIAGLRVLDLGCGVGDLTIRYLAAGASVTALDLSPKMIDVVRERVAAFAGRPVAPVVAPVEATGLLDASFDVIAGKYILHHVDVAAAAREIHRLLAPGGRAVFAENSGDNPILMFARGRLAGRFGIVRFGTPDEHPLRRPDYEAIREVFGNVQVTYPVFFFFTLVDRQLLRFRFALLSRILKGMDRAIGRSIPPLRRLSYRVFVEARRCTRLLADHGIGLPARHRRKRDTSPRCSGAPGFPEVVVHLNGRKAATLTVWAGQGPAADVVRVADNVSREFSQPVVWSAPST